MKKISFSVIKYFPSLGGTELLAKQVIEEISNLNLFDITVKTTPEVNRENIFFPYKIKEDVFLLKNEKYDLNIFFSDLWSPQLNSYSFDSDSKHICILNLDEITYAHRDSFVKATENLKKFDLVLTFSKNGIANKFLNDEKIKHEYIANFSRDIFSTKPVFSIKEKLKLDDKKIGLYCAAFDKRKNQLYFLKTLKETKLDKEYNWIFIGNESDKNYLKECQKYAKDNSLKNIFFLSSIKDEEKINSLYQQIDFVVLASTAEGTPLTLIEAASANKPFIFTPVGGTAGVFEEIINDGAYPLQKINYDGNDLLIKINNALSYNTNSSRLLWEKEHKKENILKKYVKHIKNIF
jgi:glycosyltransferase involved in cell wall biosynthesis